MSDIVHATSGGVDLPVELDFATHEWTSTVEDPEGEFPFIATVAGKRYELYSDGTFGEEELNAT